jgi:hypothetical protein
MKTAYEYLCTYGIQPKMAVSAQNQVFIMNDTLHLHLLLR